MLFNMLEQALIELVVDLSRLLVHGLEVKETLVADLDAIVVIDEIPDIRPTLSGRHNFVRHVGVGQVPCQGVQQVNQVLHHVRSCSLESISPSTR